MVAWSVNNKINNSRFLSSKFNSYYQKAGLNFLKFSFKSFLIKFSKQAQLSRFCQSDFLLIVGTDILVWQVYYFIRFFRHGTGSLLRYRLHQTFILHTDIPWNRKSIRYSGLVSCYMLIKYEDNLRIFSISKGVPGYLYTKYYLVQQ